MIYDFGFQIYDYSALWVLCYANKYPCKSLIVNETLAKFSQSKNDNILGKIQERRIHSALLKYEKRYENSSRKRM
jgi:hypothetical protein